MKWLKANKKKKTGKDQNKIAYKLLYLKHVLLAGHKSLGT